jgi:coenzyme F420 hydrogenase subunit beta
MIAEGTDLFAGPVRACYLVQHRRHEVLAAAQSGGVVTGLLLHLLESGRLDRALVTVMPTDGSLRPYSVLTKDPAVIRQSCGSKYCPVSLNARLSEIDAKERIAVVGLPCHLHGVAHLCRHLQRWRRENLLLIGLVCDRVLSFRAMDYLVHRAGLRRQDVRSLRFRSKQRKGWPGDVRIITRDGKSHFLPARERIACKDLFTPQRCRLCFDKMNILSDITCGDPHGLSKDVKGRSAVLARTSEGQSAVQAAIQAGVFGSRSISADDLFAGQKIENKRRDYAAYVELWNARGRTAPRVPIAANRQHGVPTSIERHVCKKRLFDFPKLVEDDSTFRRSLRSIRWNRHMKLFNRLDHLLLGKVVS